MFDRTRPLRIVLISPKGPLYRRRGGIFRQTQRYMPLTLPTLAALVPRSRLRSAWLRRLTGTAGRDVVGRFTPVGATLAWASVLEPTEFHVLFTAQPRPDGGSTTQTVWFLPRRLGAAPLRAALLMGLLLRDDRRVLDRLAFHRGFAAGDGPLERDAHVIDALERA